MAPNNQSRSLPVNVGEQVVLTIAGVGEKGDGIARKSGYVIFVPEAQAGKRYKIEIVKTLEKVGFGKIIGEVEIPPEQKVVPPPQKEELNAEDASEEFGEE